MLEKEAEVPFYFFSEGRTAAQASDYEVLGGEVIRFEAGQGAAEVVIVPVDDEILEPVVRGLPPGEELRPGRAVGVTPALPPAVAPGST